MKPRHPETEPRGSKTLPLHISEEPGRFTVRIRRGAMTYRASVALGQFPSRQAALDHAIRLRDQFEIAAGPVCYPKRRKARAALSNTGIVGITETVKWTHYRPRYCFHVALAGHPTCKRIYYGRRRTRDQALKLAIELRRQTFASHV